MNDVNSLSTRINSEIETLLQSVAEEEGLRDYKIEKAAGSLKGDGYMGDITTICISGNTESDQRKVLNLVVKSASKSNALRKEAPISSIFEREIYMYNCVLPTFRKFETEKGLPPFSSLAKCYKGCLIDRSEALILENLKNEGYCLWERRIPMNHDHLSFVMEVYGHFHAISFALRDQKPEVLQNLTEPMDDVFQKFVNNNFLKMFTSKCEKALESLDAVADKQAYGIFKTFIEKGVAKVFQELHKLVDNYSTIVHGDGWTNNMMFKYEDEKDHTKPMQMCLIDLQIARVGSPVLDLSYFLYACGTKEAITNYEYYLNVYYNSLSEHLRKLGSNPEKVYPYTVFRQQWKDGAKFGLICSTLLIHAMLSEQDEVADFTEIAESGKSVIEAFDYSIANIEEYNDRVRHIILHFVNNKFI